jgi:hypothetical protein
MPPLRLYYFFSHLLFSHPIALAADGEIIQLNDEQEVEIYNNLDKVYGNMETTYDKLLDIEDFVNAKYTPGVKFLGCNAFDEDNNNINDECEEDTFPPEIVLPLSVDRSGGTVRILGKSFKTSDQAKAYLESAIDVIDDCAPPSDLMLEVKYVDGACDLAQFSVTPIHKAVATCSARRGSTTTFFVKVTGKDTAFCQDNYPPEVVLPLPSDVIDRSDGAVRIIGKSFASKEEAAAYLKSMVGVKDDCAPAKDLDLVVTHEEEGTCDEAKFTVTPTHDTGCGVVEGVAQEFFVKVTGKDTVFCQDNYPPEVVLPLPFDVIDRSDGAVRIIGKSFVSNKEAAAYLKSMIGVTDDCAPAKDLDLVVTYIEGECDEAKFTVTPTHDTGCGIVEGVTQVFIVTVDGSPPEPMCRYGVGGTIPETGSGVLVDAQLTYSVKENCGGPVSVTVEMFSNELEDFNSQQMVLLSRDTSSTTNTKVGMWLASTICSTNSNGQCITDPNEPGRRYYVTTVTATDKGGLTGKTECFVEIGGSGSKKNIGSSLAVPGWSVQRFPLDSFSTAGYIPDSDAIV